MIFKSKFPDCHPPEEYQNSLGKYYWHQLDKFSDNVLWVDYVSGRELTGAEIKNKSSKIAFNLMNNPIYKLQPRDPAVLLYKNDDKIHLAAMGIIFAGGVVCVGSPFDPSREVTYMVKCLKPKIVFLDWSLYDTIAELLVASKSNGNQLDYAICIMNDLEPECRKILDANKHVLGFHRDLLGVDSDITNPNGNTLSPVNDPRLPVIVDPDDAAYILLTSGSTGKPKPSIRSHRNSLYVCFCLDTATELWYMDDKSVLAGHLQLDHGTGTFSIKMCLSKGLKLVIMDGFQIKTMSDAIERYKITDCLLGSALLHNFMVAEEIVGEYDISSLRNLISVGSPLACHKVKFAFMNFHKGLSVRQSYGMTEGGFLAFVSREESFIDSLESNTQVGYTLPNVQVKLLDPDTNDEVGEFDEVGKFHVKAPTVSPGYLGADYEQQSKLCFMSDGFYMSNDLACITKDGRLVIKGRQSEVLCLHDGWKVLPHEVESVLMEHPAVLEAAVIGVAHQNLPTCHAVRAYIVLKRGAKLDENELHQFAASQMSEAKLPVGGVKFLSEMPRISVGKVDRRALRMMDNLLPV